MTNHAPITAQTITKEQAGRAADRFIAKCMKQPGSLPKDLVQEVLESEGDALAQEQFEALRKRVEARSEMIVRHFKLDRKLQTKKEMIAALGRKEYVNDDVLLTMPIKGPDEGDLYFFPAKRYIPVGELAREFEIRGLVPHPLAQMQVNIDDPSFGDDHPNGVQWQDEKKRFCYASFDRWLDERSVDVKQNDYGWSDSWWFAGVRKPATV